MQMVRFEAVLQKLDLSEAHLLNNMITKLTKQISHLAVAYLLALVEAGGIEPPSASPIRAALRTCFTNLI